MPQIEVPLRKAEDIKGLRKNKQAMAELAELVELADEIKKKEDRAAELRLSLYPQLAAALDADEKSFQFGEARISAYQGEPRRTLDKTKLAKYISADKLAKCYTVGEPPRPTVSVTFLENRKQQIARLVTNELTGKKSRR